MEKRSVNESKYLSRAKAVRKEAEAMLGMALQLVGAVGGDELEQMVSGALDAASNLMAFAYYFLNDGTVPSHAVVGNLKKAVNAADRLVGMKQSVVEPKVDPYKESEEIYVDPYESEYLPADMIMESINEDSDPLPDDLDDDPDALFSLDPEGMPVKFNNTPIELDPFAVKLFRNNAELVDPPEVFDAVQDASDSVEPDLEPGSASAETVDDAEREQVIDVIADVPDEEEKKEVVVELPTDDFDVFANESKSLQKNVPGVLPPKFEKSAVHRANENIAEDPGNNLKMLSFLAQDW